jgi:hypothetical protein
MSVRTFLAIRSSEYQVSSPLSRLLEHLKSREPQNAAYGG